MRNIEIEKSEQHLIHKMIRVSYTKIYGPPDSKEQMLKHLNAKKIDEVIMLFWKHYREGEYPKFEYSPEFLKYGVEKYLDQNS
jgi:hypothetical protein